MKVLADLNIRRSAVRPASSSASTLEGTFYNRVQGANLDLDPELCQRIGHSGFISGVLEEVRSQATLSK